MLMGMKQILVMMAAVVLVGCGNKTPETSQSVEAEAQVATKPTPEPDPVSPADEKLITDPIVEKAVRYSLEADGLLAVTLPVVELTKTDLKKVTGLILINNEITDEGLKEVAKLQKLEYLNLYGSQITKAAVVEFKKSLPNCKIEGP